VRAGWRVAVPVAFALAGLLFATSAGVSHGSDLRGSRSDLPDLIRAEEARLHDATARLERIQADINDATDQAAEQDSRVRAERHRADRLAMAAGTTAVRGPGMSVTLSDAPRASDRALPAGTSPDDLVVHQQDVQAVVNALWAGGADAMQIMDQRAINTSAVRYVGNTLILAGRVYSPPYTITAIGDPQLLGQALDASPGVAIFRYYADHYGLGYETASLTSVRLPGYHGSLDLAHAKAGA
jgi:uncharacterized protein YlxW (UPF0749 family)